MKEENCKNVLPIHRNVNKRSNESEEEGDEKKSGPCHNMTSTADPWPLY